MHTTTVIVILSVHLVLTGALLVLIGKRTPQGDGLGWFGAGSILFGLCIACRLKTGTQTLGADGALLDAGMVLSMLLWWGGLRLFMGRAAPQARWLAAALLLYLVAAAGAATLLGVAGRHALLNAALSGTQLALAGLALGSLRGTEPALRLPLAAVGAMMAGMALLTALRALVALAVGAGPLFHGPLANAYTAAGSLVAVLLGPLVLWMLFVRLNARLAELATHDPLTRLLNRAGLDEVLRRHFGTREPLPVSVLQIDVDHFKQINDRHGHGAGDAVLCALAETVGRSMRVGDFAARTGGEEFLIGCVSTQPDAAAELAARLHAAVAALDIEAFGTAQTLRCTVSIGVSLPVSGQHDWGAALREADRALYAAKEGGRNRVVLAGSAPMPPVAVPEEPAPAHPRLVDTIEYPAAAAPAFAAGA